MPVLDVGAGGGLSLAALAQQLGAATTPLLVRGLFDGGGDGDGDGGWAAMASALGNRSSLLERFGAEQVQLSVGQLLAHGPESRALDRQKLRFMRERWGAAPAAVPAAAAAAAAAARVAVLGDSVGRQVRAGEARPRVRLGEWLAALREGTSLHDAYVFHNVSAGPVAQALAPLHALWRDVMDAQHMQRWPQPQQAQTPRRPPWPAAAGPPALARLGVGGSGSGAPFHDHDVLALNVAFAGRKRWLVAPPCRPACRIPSAGGAALYHPEVLLSQTRLPAVALRVLSGAKGAGTWDCTQHAREMVFVPALFLHATINLDHECVAAAVQCDDGADPRAGLRSHLSALVVHASGAAAAPGPCGIPWQSPFGANAADLGADEALGMLRGLRDHFRGDPVVYLNRAGSDGHAPADVAVQFGSVASAAALAAHGARFSQRHLAGAQQRGHEALAVFIGSKLAE
jgi:hypothetical protein